MPMSADFQSIRTRGPEHELSKVATRLCPERRHAASAAIGKFAQPHGGKIEDQPVRRRPLRRRFRRARLARGAAHDFIAHVERLPLRRRRGDPWQHESAPKRRDAVH
jgi:hypothetical protein